MLNSLKSVAEPVDLIVPVPLYWQRRWQRGFNQAEVLARMVAKKLDVAFADPLLRQRSTQPQFRLTKQWRASNVSGAFRVKTGRQRLFGGKIVVVVDDVVATGSTIEECARLLKQEGAKEVWGLVIARA